jgi:hypothetical protein
MLALSQILSNAASHPWVKREQTASLATERLLRIVQCSAMLGIALNVSQLSVLGRTLDLKQVNAWTGWARFGIYAHFAGHDLIGACKPSKKIDPNTPKLESDANADGLYGSLPVLNGLIFLLFMHQNGYLGLNLGKSLDMVESNFKGLWFAVTLLDFYSTIKTWQTKESLHEGNDLKDLAQARREAIRATIDTFLWMPAALFISQGRYQGAMGLIAGSYGLYKICTKAWEDHQTNEAG